MFDAFMSEIAHFPLTVDQLAIVGEVGEGLPIHQPHHTGNTNCRVTLALGHEWT